MTMSRTPDTKQEKIAHDCKTTVLTRASSALRYPDRLALWVERMTGSPDYDLLTLPKFDILGSTTASVLTRDLSAAVTLHNGERLLSYTDTDLEPLFKMMRECMSKEMRENVRMDAYSIPYRIMPEIMPVDTVVIGCMDFRLHRNDAQIHTLSQALGEDASGFDLFSTAGGGKELHYGQGRFEVVNDQLQRAKYRNVIILSHTDCGKYGGAAAFKNAAHQYASLAEDLAVACDLLRRNNQNLDVRAGIVHLEDDDVSRVTLF